MLQLLFGRTYKHIPYEMCLPSYLHYKTNFDSRFDAGATKSIHHVEFLTRQFADGYAFEFSPSLLCNRLVVVRIFGRCPPNGIFGYVVHYEKFVFRRASRIDACHNIDGSEFGKLTSVKPCQIRICFFFVKSFIRRIVDNFGYPRYSVF